MAAPKTKRYWFDSAFLAFRWIQDFPKQQWYVYTSNKFGNFTVTDRRVWNNYARLIDHKELREMAGILPTDTNKLNVKETSVKSFSEMTYDEVIALAEQKKNEETTKEKSIPHYVGYEAVAKALINMRPDLFNDNDLQTVKTKVSDMVRYGALGFTPRGNITVESLEKFAEYGATVTITPKDLVPGHKCPNRGKKGGREAVVVSGCDLQFSKS